MAGPTMAQLSVKLDADAAMGQVNALNKSLDSLAAQEQRLAAADRQRAAAAEAMRQAAYADRFQTDAQARAMGQAEIQAYKMAAAQQAHAVAAGGAAASISRVREAVTSMTAQMLQAAPGVTQLTSVLGAQALGGPVIVSVLAGIAAVVTAWGAWHEEANKARAEQDKLTTSLLNWYDKQKEGPAGELPKQIEAMTQKIKDLRKELDGLSSNSFFTKAGAVGATVGAGGSKAMAWIRVLTGGDATGIATQFAVELAKGTAVKEAAIKKDSAAVVAANKEAAKRIADAEQEAFEKAEKERKKREAEAAKNFHAIIESAANEMRNEAMANAARTEATERNTKAITDNVVAMQKQLAERFKQQSQSGAQQAQRDQADVDAAKKYADQMRQDWIRGIDGIITHGLSSFSNFFESVLQMFTRMLATMEKAGKANGIGAKLLGLGSAAIGGGLAGYQIGQQSGSSATGFLGGAASGALAGSAFGVPGAVIGGLAGAAGGLLGASKSQKDAAEQLRLAALQLQAQAGAFIAASRSGNSVIDALNANAATVAALLKAGGFTQTGRTAKAKYTGEDIEDAGARNAKKIADDFWAGITSSLNALRGPEGAYLNGLAEIEKQYNENRASAIALNATESQLAEIEDLRTGKLKELAAATALATQRATEDLQLRIAQARGGPGAGRAGFEAAQRREREDASGWSPGDRALLDIAQALDRVNFERDEQIAAVQAASDREQAAFDAQLRIAQDALNVAQDQLRAQEQAVAATRQVVDSLTQFAASLKLNTSLTTLSPIQQAAEAKKQYEALLAKAWSGDKDAAGGLPAAAQAFLTASRAVNASGQSYVADFLKVQGEIADVTERYGAQLTVEQQILQQLQQQAAALQAQIDAINVAKAAAAANSAAEIAAINANADTIKAAIGTQINPNDPIWTDPTPSGGGGPISPPLNPYTPPTQGLPQFPNNPGTPTPSPGGGNHPTPVAYSVTASQVDETNTKLQVTVDTLTALVSLQAAANAALVARLDNVEAAVDRNTRTVQDGNDANATRRVYVQ